MRYRNQAIGPHRYPFWQMFCNLCIKNLKAIDICIHKTILNEMRF